MKTVLNISVKVKHNPEWSQVPQAKLKSFKAVSAYSRCVGVKPNDPQNQPRPQDLIMWRTWMVSGVKNKQMP